MLCAPMMDVFLLCKYSKKTMLLMILYFYDMLFLNVLVQMLVVHVCKPGNVLVCESSSGPNFKCYNCGFVTLDICFEVSIFVTFILVLGVNILFKGGSQLIYHNLFFHIVNNDNIWFQCGYYEGREK